MLKAVVVVVLVACGDRDTEPPPAIEDDPDIREYVTTDVLGGLDANGHFVIDPDVVPGEGESVVGAEYARGLAGAFAASFGPAFRTFWEQSRGGPIHLAALEPSTRVYPIQSAYGRMPQVGCHPTFQRHYGSHYLMTLDSGATPEVIISVAAQTTDYSVSSDGNLVSPNRTGGDFYHDGIPRTKASGVLLSPEQAVAIAARATGARIIAMPRLVTLGPNYAPVAALWEVLLDRTVSVQASSSTRSTSTLYVTASAESRFRVSTVAQPDSVTFVCALIDENLIDHGTATIKLGVLNGPVSFEPATLTK